jgi:hypothetical protein
MRNPPQNSFTPFAGAPRRLAMSGIHASSQAGGRLRCAKKRLPRRWAGCYSTTRLARSLARFLVLIAAVQILGGHWAVLQTVAWVGMAIDYAQTDSLGGALDKTFSGEHPCNLCQVVTRGVNEEKKHEAGKVLVKLEAVLAPAVQLPPRHAGAWTYPFVIASVVRRDLAPPTPPPLG